jgi:hypothetical protein
VFDRGQPDFLALGMSLAIIAVPLVGGLVYFKKQERQFADVI